MAMATDAVLLIAFGGPTRPEEIRPFLENVVRGRRISPERLDAVVRHYERIGGRSPLNALTFRQAEALRGVVGRLPVYVGMRNWSPYIAETLTTMVTHGVRDAVGVILSPFACEASRERYTSVVDEARAALGPRAPRLRYVPSWHAHPGFITAMAERVTTALATIPDMRRRDAMLVFTNHSIPTAMADASPYVAEFTAASEATATRVAHPRWTLAYQSRSGSPQDPWLEPDVNDVLATLHADGVRDVVLVPIGFLCDHVEVLYDLDVEARETAARLGVSLARATTVTDHPAFIAMLAELIRAAAA
jgi:ferrochelatase